MKLFLLLMVTFITASPLIFGQTIKDFYIPAKKYLDTKKYLDKASFYIPDEREYGGHSAFVKEIFYKKVDNLTYEIEERNTDTWIGKIVSNMWQTIIISPTEIKMSHLFITNIIEKGSKESNYEPAITLLKMPEEGKVSNWTINEKNIGSLSSQKFSSSWTTLIIDGFKYKAIKVIAQNINSSININSSVVSYYAQGIGLIKIDVVSDKGEVKPLYVFDGLSTIPNSLNKH